MNDHTVLSLACAGGHLAVVELLLAHGADPLHKLKVRTLALKRECCNRHILVYSFLFVKQSGFIFPPLLSSYHKVCFLNFCEYCCKKYCGEFLMRPFEGESFFFFFFFFFQKNSACHVRQFWLQ